eukprot:4106851-Amphidinium_carterae.1
MPDVNFLVRAGMKARRHVEGVSICVEEMGGGYYGFTGSFNEDASMKLPSDPFHLTPDRPPSSPCVEKSAP